MHAATANTVVIARFRLLVSCITGRDPIFLPKLDIFIKFRACATGCRRAASHCCPFLSENRARNPQQNAPSANGSCALRRCRGRSASCPKHRVFGRVFRGQRRNATRWAEVVLADGLLPPPEGQLGRRDARSRRARPPPRKDVAIPNGRDSLFHSVRERRDRSALERDLPTTRYQIAGRCVFPRLFVLPRAVPHVRGPLVRRAYRRLRKPSLAGRLTLKTLEGGEQRQNFLPPREKYEPLNGARVARRLARSP
jgi:hypothetical protein